MIGEGHASSVAEGRPSSQQTSVSTGVWNVRDISSACRYMRPFLCPKIAWRCRMSATNYVFTGVMTVNAPTRPKAEIALLGKEIYERDIRSEVEADHSGEYVAIDVETGDWAIANNEREALERLRAMRPGAVDVLMDRIGYRALRSFGAGSLRRTG